MFGKNRVIEIRPLKALTYIHLVSTGIQIVKAIQDASEKASQGVDVSLNRFKILANLGLASRLIWDVCEKPWNPISRFFLKIAFFKQTMAHVEWAHEVLLDALESNGRLFFLQSCLANYQLVQKVVWSRETGSGPSQEILNRAHQRGLLFSQSEN